MTTTRLSRIVFASLATLVLLLVSGCVAKKSSLQGVSALGVATSGACTAPVLTGRADGPLKWQSPYMITSHPIKGYGDMFWNHIIHLQNTGKKTIVLDRVYVTGMPRVPTPVIKTATVGILSNETEAVIKTVQGTVPVVKGYKIPPGGFSGEWPYLVLGLGFPACATTGRNPPEYAYGQNYVVIYHQVG